MKKINSQLVNTLLIAIGGGLLIFLIAMEEKEKVYLLVLGIVLLMFGLYRATNHWVYTQENSKLDKDPNDRDKNLKEENDGTW